MVDYKFIKNLIKSVSCETCDTKSSISVIEELLDFLEQISCETYADNTKIKHKRDLKIVLAILILKKFIRNNNDLLKTVRQHFAVIRSCINSCKRVSRKFINPNKTPLSTDDTTSLIL